MLQRRSSSTWAQWATLPISLIPNSLGVKGQLISVLGLTAESPTHRVVSLETSPTCRNHLLPIGYMTRMAEKMAEKEAAPLLCHRAALVKTLGCSNGSSEELLGLPAIQESCAQPISCLALFPTKLKHYFWILNLELQLMGCYVRSRQRFLGTQGNPETSRW